MKWSNCYLVLALLFVVITPMQSVHAQARTGTGFVYPIGQSTWNHACGGWLERSSPNGCYTAGYYHIAEDMLTAEGSNVYAISDGDIARIWTTDANDNYYIGPGNSVIFVTHRLQDGSYFLAEYMHVRPTVWSGHVVAGQVIAKVGPWYNSTHLHFGIHPDTNVPTTRWGRMPNSLWPDTNGFVDPVNWITARAPWSDCTPANVSWTWTPTENRWYHSNEHLTYSTSGSNISVATSAMYLADAGRGWHDYWAHAWNSCGDVTVHWAGGWDDLAPDLGWNADSVPSGTWLNGTQYARWHWSDANSGVKSGWYSWNGGAHSDGGVGYAQLPEGKNTLQVYVEDNAWTGGTQSGNSSTISAQFWLDTTPPLVTATLTPAAPNGDNNWYTANPILTVAATDPNGANGSGVAALYRTIGGQPEAPYISPLQVAGNGVVTYSARATDVAGNSGGTGPLTVKIDTTPPAFNSITTNPTSGGLDSLAACWDFADLESDIAEYAYWIGTTPGLDDTRHATSAGTDHCVVAQNLGLTPGFTYYFTIKAKNQAGLWSEPEASSGILIVPGSYDQSPNFGAGGVSHPVDAHISPNYVLVDSMGQFVVDASSSQNVMVEHGYWHSDIATPPALDISQAKRTPDDIVIQLGAQASPLIVTAVFGDRFYVSNANRVSGIAAQYGLLGGPTLTEGDRVWLIGHLNTVSGERMIQFADVHKVP
ncbi:MAG: M23 family metallopeptidase [Armatimonadetes bacterium]|nr:M23 family metallopeptidase [Armatimonadota bacterium]